MIAAVLMDLLDSRVHRMPFWARPFQTSQAPKARRASNVNYDIWLRDSDVIFENQRAPLPATFRLGAYASRAVTIRPHMPMRLVCVVGTVWATKDRDSNDYVLTTGQALDVAPDQDVVVFAISYGVLRVEAALLS